jgi:hypothetical protein
MGRVRGRISYANVAATMALVLAMSGGAVAATGGFSSGGTLHACVTEEGAIRLLKGGRHCKKGQTPIAWNQSGPAGPRGASGSAGAQGAAGPEGPKGKQGDPGTEGESATVNWAKVRQTGEITASEGVGTATQANTGEYMTVSFEEDVNNCAITVTPDEGVAGVTTEARSEGSNVKVFMTYKESPILEGFSIVATCF